MSPARVNLEVMITGYDPELWELRDRAPSRSRLAEIGNGRSTRLSRKRPSCHGYSGGTASTGGGRTELSTRAFQRDREQLRTARLQRSMLFWGRLDRALAEMTAVRAARPRRMGIARGFSRLLLGFALWKPRPLYGSREAFTAALDIRTGSGPAAEIDATGTALGHNPPPRGEDG
jgi:hypothetical protein